MCQFITAILPNDADAAEVAAAFRRHGRACTAYVNATLAAQIGSAESTYCTTPGHCDCGTLLGSAVIEAVADDRDGDDAPDSRGIEAARLRRKGWSESKIERALMQRDEAKARPIAPRRGEQPQTGLDVWSTMIREVLALPGTAYVGLLVHGYRGGIHDEEIALQDRQVIRAGHLSEAALASMRADTIHEFRR